MLEVVETDVDVRERGDAKADAPDEPGRRPKRGGPSGPRAAQAQREEPHHAEPEPDETSTAPDPEREEREQREQRSDEPDFAEIQAALGPAAEHLMKAAGELMLAFRHAVTALARPQVDVERLRVTARTQALEEIAGAIRDEMAEVRHNGHTDPEAALARMAALAEVLGGIERQLGRQRAAEPPGEPEPAKPETGKQDVTREWARHPSGELEQVPLEVEE